MRLPIFPSDSLSKLSLFYQTEIQEFQIKSIYTTEFLVVRLYNVTLTGQKIPTDKIFNSAITFFYAKIKFP